MGTPFFVLQLPHPVNAVDDAEAGTTVPVHEHRTSVIHRGNCALAAKNQLAVGIVHLDKLHTTSDRIERPNSLYRFLIRKAVISHKVRPLPPQERVRCLPSSAPVHIRLSTRCCPSDF